MIEIKLSIEEYLKYIINDLKKSDTCKLQLAIAINFISSKDSDERRVMHSKIYYTEFMIYDNADEVIEEIFQSIFAIYKIALEKSMRGSDFIFDCVHLLCYKCHKINPNRCGSYIDSPIK